MCQQPRCREGTVYVMTGTQHGKMNLCAPHKRLYQVNHPEAKFQKIDPVSLTWVVEEDEE